MAPEHGQRALFRDPRNTARETRARYTYQDECVALRVIRNLLSDDVASVVLEWATDYALCMANCDIELVSVKHLEPSQGSWTLGRLEKSSVLTDLHRVWRAMDERGHYTFESNAGLHSSLRELTTADTLTDPLVRAVAKRIRVAPDEVARFLGSFVCVPVPLPRRNEITDIATQEMRVVLGRLGCDERSARASYEALVARIASASTDVPPSAAERVSRLTGLMRSVLERMENERLGGQTLMMSELRQIVISSAEASPVPDGARGLLTLRPDPLFTGRAEQLGQLRALLRPGEHAEVAPVSLHGLTGIGKTALAMEFAARHANVLRVAFIPAGSRQAVLKGVSDLTGGLSDRGGSALPIEGNEPHLVAELPRDPALLVIFDGLVDPADLNDVVSRTSPTRVIITTTMTHIDNGTTDVRLRSWSTEEALAYVRRTLATENAADGKRLANEMGGHPLALVQAVHYCLTEQLAIDAYLRRFTQAPLNALALGSAAGYAESTLRAIDLSIQAVSRRSSVAIDLLRVLSYAAPQAAPDAIFDSERIVAAPEAIFDGERIIALLDIPPRRPEAVDRWLHRILPSHRRPWKILNALTDPQLRDEAVAVLHKYSLVRRRAHELTTHPLVQTVVRESIPDKETPTYLKVALGRFGRMVFDDTGVDGKDSFDDAARALPHMLSVVDHACSKGHRPPMAVWAYCTASDLYGDLGDNERSNQLAKRAVKAAREQYDPRGYSAALSRLSRSYQALGNPDQALNGGCPEFR